MNNREREMWIDNDEGLYSWWLSSRQSKRVFIQENRAEIDAAISQALNRKPVS
jgi:hypothetical protein